MEACHHPTHIVSLNIITDPPPLSEFSFVLSFKHTHIHSQFKIYFLSDDCLDLQAVAFFSSVFHLLYSAINPIVIMCAQPFLYQYMEILWEWGSVTPYPPLRLLHHEKVFTDRHDNNFTLDQLHNLTNLWESVWDSVHIISSFYYLLVLWLSFFLIYLIYNFKLSVWTT